MPEEQNKLHKTITLQLNLIILPLHCTKNMECDHYFFGGIIIHWPPVPGILNFVNLILLSGGVAVIKVGAATETELKERKLRIEDALNSTRAAVEEGIVSGGGIALIQVISEVEKLQEEGDVQTGINIIKKSLEAPLRQIAENAGVESSVIVAKIKESEIGIGYNAATGEWVDMIKEGIVDPTKVTRSALQNAASVSSLFLSTEAVVADITPEEPTPQMPMM